VYSALAAAILALHLLFILLVVFGATVTRRRPVLRWLHLGSLIWGMLIEILPWNCPLTWAENFLEAGAGVAPYQGGFLLHYLDALVYPDVPPGLLTGFGVAVCVVNLGIYAVRFHRRRLTGWWKAWKKEADVAIAYAVASAGVNVPDAALVGRSSGDTHWPVLGLLTFGEG